MQYKEESLLYTYLYTLDILEKRLEDVEVVCDILVIFQEILGLPPLRVVEFRIDLVSGATTLSKATYRMAHKLFDEIKKQLVELMEKGYMCYINFMPLFIYLNIDELFWCVWHRFILPVYLLRKRQ